MNTIEECDAVIAGLDKRIASAIDATRLPPTHSELRALNRRIGELRADRRIAKSRRALLFSQEKSKTFMHVAQQELDPATFGRVYAAYEAQNA